MSPTDVEIRQFILNSFKEAEFVDLFCTDHFPEAKPFFSTDMPYILKVQSLIEYCQNRGVIQNLLTALQQERQEVYAQRFGQVLTLPEQLPATSKDSVVLQPKVDGRPEQAETPTERDAPITLFKKAINSASPLGQADAWLYHNGVVYRYLDAPDHPGGVWIAPPAIVIVYADKSTDGSRTLNSLISAADSLEASRLLIEQLEAWQASGIIEAPIWNGAVPGENGPRLVKADQLASSEGWVITEPWLCVTQASSNQPENE